MLPYGTDMRSILSHNPTVSDKALAGVIEANIRGFKGNISVVSKAHSFAAGSLNSRVIYITPYGKITDLFVDVKRFFAGVSFTGGNPDQERITKYVFGEFELGSTEHLQVEGETNRAFAEGRRLKIVIANDLSDMGIYLDQDEGGCSLL